MKRQRRLSQRLINFYVLFAAVLLALVGGLAVYSGRQALEAATISNLESTATEKEAALNTWLAERQEDIIILTDTFDLQEQLTNFVSAPPDSASAHTASAEVVTDLNPQTGVDKQFLAISVLEPETGRVIIATDTNEVGKFRESEAAFINGKVAPYVEGPYYSLQFQSPTMTIGAPLHSAQGKLLGVLVGRLNLSRMTPIILRRSDVQQTEDAYLVNVSSLFITQPRFISDPVVLQRGVHTVAVQKCLTRNSGVVSDIDYRGVPAIAVFRWLADHQICLVVKLDRSEAFAPSSAFGVTILLISGVTLVVTYILALVLARTITRPVLALQAGAARFAQGDLSIRLAETSDDELGLLAREFNMMAASLAEQEKQLRTYTGELEHLVQERTAALRESETELRALFSAITDVILVFDSTGKLNKIAPTTPDANFRPPPDLIGKRLHDLYPAAQGDQFLQGIRQALDIGQTTHHEYVITIRGTEYCFDASISPLTEDSVLLVARDITANKRAETALRQEAVLRASEERYRGLFDNAPIGISVTRGLIRLYVNSAYLRMFGYDSFQETIGLSVIEQVAPSHRAAVIEKLSNGPPPNNQIISLETLVRRQDESLFTIHLQLARLDLTDGPAQIAFIEDITERKRAEEQLATQAQELARSNQELEQFAYIASHDLQEPLRMVTSFMGLLSRRYQGKLDEKADMYIGYAVDGATRMQQLINDLLAFSRVGSRARDFALSDCEKVLAHVLRNLSVAVKESAAQITHDPLPTILADETQLDQLFQNLIGNAIKFHGDAPPQVHISAEQQGLQWLFSIQDNGIGIEPESAEDVFGIFKRLHTRREYAGTGLGLAICKKIVERHNGRIWLKSEPNKGTTFYFSLPAGSHKS